ncbi:hypothetical protein Neosp_008964 [[Neocosmospora] mangrovei]
MGKSTKRRDQANDTSARPEKRRRHREPEPETDPESERGHSSSPVPAKKVPGRPSKNATTVISKDSLKATLAFLEKSRPPVQEEDLDKLVGPTAPPLHDKWTQQDEDAMMAEWNASPEKVVYASISGPSPAITSMWKVSLRVMRRSPLDIISPLEGLRYQPPAAASQAGMWSREFCNRLAVLMAYPLWQGTTRRLVIALQYAVICRTDDRRPWKPSHDCPALTLLREYMEQVHDSELSQPVHKLHKLAREMVTKAGDEPSTLSNFLVCIRETVKGWNYGRSQASVTSHDGFDVYSVNVQDLKVLEAAIDSFFESSTDMAYQTFKNARGSAIEIPQASQLPEFYERASRHQLRRIKMTQRDRDEAEGEDEDEDEEMARPRPESESSGSDMELGDQPAPDESESESRPEDEADPSSESDSGPHDEISMEIDDEAPPGDETELDHAPPSVPPAPFQPVRPVRRRLALPSPQATAPNTSTPMPSHDMQEVMKAVNDLLKQERDEMKASLESSQEGMRVEMAKIQERLDKIQKCQGRQEAAIKALTEALTSQNQAPDNLEKEVATTAKATETPLEQVRGSGSPLPSTERGVEWRGTNLVHQREASVFKPPR